MCVCGDLFIYMVFILLETLATAAKTRHSNGGEGASSTGPGDAPRDGSRKPKYQILLTLVSFYSVL